MGYANLAFLLLFLPVSLLVYSKIIYEFIYESAWIFKDGFQS